MRLLVIGLLIVSLQGAGPMPDAAAQSATASDTSGTVDASEEPQDGSWLTRTLKRYFGRSRQQGEDLDGTAVELVDRYADFIGKTIEVVIVYQVERFDPYWDAEQGSSQRILHSATRPFHSYTKDALIREYLLFEDGQPVDPFLLADSERMLRELDFINDVRIILVPISGDSESVAVVVETRDRWPFGITGRVNDVNRYDLNLFFSNLGGYGFRWDNKLIYRGDMEPNVGYEGRLRKRNLWGSFIDAALLFEDSWRRVSRQATLERDLIHPGIRMVGGAHWENTDIRDHGGEPRAFELGDYWLGRSIPLSSLRSNVQSARPVLVPAVRFRNIDYQVRPIPFGEFESRYRNTRDYLVGLTFQRFRNYKTSYLFKMGETEDLPGGLALKLSGGYQELEHYDRTSAFFQAAYSLVRPSGRAFVGTLDLGSYFRDHVGEDGALHLTGMYFTPLMGQGRFRHRFLSNLAYTLAFNRDSGGTLVLGDISGIRGLENNRVLGNQRLVLKMESRVFTPWALLGFRFMVFGYADVGTVGPDIRPIYENKIYSSLGFGFRINNPDLVMPSTQVRMGWVNSVEETKFVLGFKLGNVDYPTIDMPGTRPGAFDFR